MLLTSEVLDATFIVNMNLSLESHFPLKSSQDLNYRVSHVQSIHRQCDKNVGFMSTIWQ